MDGRLYGMVQVVGGVLRERGGGELLLLLLFIKKGQQCKAGKE